MCLSGQVRAIILEAELRDVTGEQTAVSIDVVARRTARLSPGKFDRAGGATETGVAVGRAGEREVAGRRTANVRRHRHRYPVGIGRQGTILRSNEITVRLPCEVGAVVLEAELSDVTREQTAVPIDVVARRTARLRPIELYGTRGTSETGIAISCSSKRKAPRFCRSESQAIFNDPPIWT